MTRRLLIQHVTDRGEEVLATLEAGETVLGREPEGNGVRINSDSISREHGVIARFRNNWFYRDLGSTNGSWLNGNQVPADHWRVVRPGDVIQLATAAVRLGSEGIDGGAPTISGLSALGGRSLVVFSNGEFHEEFPIPEYGRALVIGGNQGDLTLEGDVYEFPSLVVERRGDNICAFSVAKEIPFQHNGERVAELRVLSDGDVLNIGIYEILYNDPRGARTESASGEIGGVQVDAGSSLRGWGVEEIRERDRAAAGLPPKRPAVGNAGRIPFGQGSFDDRDEGKSMPTTVYNTRGGVAQQQQPEDTYTALEDKIIIGLVVFLLVAVLSLLVYLAAA